MIRKITLETQQSKFYSAMKEVISVCINNSKHPNDIVVCSQNGSYDYNNCPMIGLGEDGIIGFQSLNNISIGGMKYLTPDKSIKQGYVYEPNELEDSIHFEMRQYLNIGENIYFIRVISQIARIGNGFHYDWECATRNLGLNKKSEFIRDKIKKRLNVFPLLSNLFENSYIGQIRNAAAHNQYQVIQGGIIFHNYNSDKYSKLEGVSFERWEEIYCNSYLIMTSVFLYLREVEKELSKASTLPYNALEIICPNKEGDWFIRHIAPRSNSMDLWSFVTL